MRRFRPQLSLRYTQILQRQHHKRFLTQSDTVSNDHKSRVAHIEEQRPRSEWYPRLRQEARTSLRHINQEYAHIAKDQTDDALHHIVGRIKSIRTAGSKLIFVDVEQDDESMQVVLKPESKEALSAFSKIARKGDIYAFNGHPHRTKKGQLSVLVTDSPELLSPCLHQIPEGIVDAEVLSHRRHVQMLVDRKAIQTLKARHTVEKAISSFLDEKNFVKVSTPILQTGAGGAVARSFKTVATEMSDRQLDLRIAPELWLKKLVIGGMSRVYEIGPVFRNEGIDGTHNPEFSICEFYAAYTTLDELMTWTEQIIERISLAMGLDNELPAFDRLEFIPTLEARLGHALPDLASAEAADELKEIFISHGIDLPSKPSLPRLLDALAAHYIEPLCDKPTFVIHHPASLSPLAKGFKCPQTGQMVSARAELYIKQREIANMYEEQNSPFEQQDAFAEQLRYRAVDGEGDGQIDHSYVEALEWALPPTGGWGCGIDRLVMLFTGKDRIADVLPFGSLRNVVNVGKGR